MKSGLALRGCQTWLLLFLIAITNLGATEKQVRLRNETIHTTKPAQRNANATLRSNEAPVSGLFLIQFTGHFQPEWREQLEQRHVKLLRYVPDDSFVTRVNNVRLSDLQNLPYAQWIGPYRAEHKLDSRLPRNQAAARGAAAEEIAIRALVTPDSDLKVIEGLRGTFRKCDRESSPRFGKILQGSVTPAQLEILTKSPSVLWIEPAPKMKLFDEVATKIIAGDDFEGGTPPLVHDLGFTGAGVTVAVADSGLHMGEGEPMHPDLDGRVDAFFYYGSLEDASDEHSHGTHVIGIVAGDGATGETDENGYLYGLGTAPEAHIVAQRIFDGVGSYEAPATFEVLTHDAVRAGAEIGSNSWGEDTQGQYDLSAAEFDALVRDADADTPGDQPYILEFSAGNAGPGFQTIGSPAVGKNVIATGASENNRFDFFIYDSGQETMADFSSRGPCADGRIKPDITAPGTWIASLRSAFANDENAWADISENYLYQGGTSQSGPAASGAAAVFVQYYRETVTNATPSPALVKAALINSAIDMDEAGGTSFAPNHEEGWGRVDLTEIIASSRQFDFVDQTVLLTNRQVFEKRILVASANEPLKITLAYTDVPGFPASIPALVNDLDLEVVAPNGSVYKGNQFDQGESIPNPPTFDAVNNVEGVHLFTPMPGEYIIRIHGQNIVEDIHSSSPARQDFALVISALIPPPGTSLLSFERRVYSTAQLAHLTLVDRDLAGQSSVSVQVSSTLETNSETLVLFAKDSLGTFTNSIMTATGSPITDGKLQIQHGNAISAAYSDVSPAGTRTAQAQADLLPPVTANVFSTNRFGKSFVQWLTDEPASSRVQYGTNSTFLSEATTAVLQVQHEVALSNLVAGVSYQYYISSTDEAGNTTTNNNDGAYFNLIPQSPAVVLLVDAYTEYLIWPPPPLTGYTDSLDEIGITYEVWDIETHGSPDYNDLHPYEAVIWRVNELQGTFAPSERLAISNYVQHGGALFVASMEATTRMDEGGAGWLRTNIFQILSYVEDVTVPQIEGVESDSITSGIDLAMDYSVYEDMYLYDFSDTITISSNASPILMEPNSGGIVGLRYPKVGVDAPGRVVFLSFPLDAVPTGGEPPNNRANLLRNILGFLLPGFDGLATVVMDKSVYSIPSLVIIEVADPDMAGTGELQVTCFSDTATNGLPLTLSETIRPGLFRGSVTLVASTNSVQPGELKVKNEDTVWTEYFDASASTVTRALATIDTVPPVITEVFSQPDYIDATIRWTTSKPADALVQFGESPLMERTGYRAELDFEHSITITGLQLDHLYYYQVTSRDAAGNTTTDNNNGNYYTFTTRRPQQAPWADNMENTGTNWLIIDEDVSYFGESIRTTSWELGTPNNGLATSAYSGTNTWGSNLDGKDFDFAHSMLISPAITLPSNSVSTLRFVHSYDFSESIFEEAYVFISTDYGNSWTDLLVFADEAASWEEVEYDLKSYLGQTIRIAFDYQVPFAVERLSGWLVDDVEIETGGALPGTIVVTNNIAQSHFTLTGPTNLQGSGWDSTFSDNPAGQYTITFSSIAFYNTPLPQTNSLNPPTPLIFQGNYTFPDANNNSISDLWEQHFFGGVSTNRTQLTDSDGDNMTDYAEFIAGTNPTNTLSILKLSAALTNQSLVASWPASLDRAYKLQGSSDATTWSAVSDWMIATNTNASFSLPINGSPYLFRLQVKP